MSKHTLSEYEEAFREAVKALKYESVPVLAHEFCEAVAIRMRSFPSGSPERASTASHMCDVMNWAILMLQVERSRCQAELRGAGAVQNYLANIKALDPAGIASGVAL